MLVEGESCDTPLDGNLEKLNEDQVNLMSTKTWSWPQVRLEIKGIDGAPFDNWCSLCVVSDLGYQAVCEGCLRSN